MRGYAEALRHYREIAGIRRAARAALLARAPDLFIGVDSLGLQPRPRAPAEGRRHPDHPLRQPVDLGLARAGACARSRARSNHILVMFPFEAPLYEKAGVPVTYVGHPLADIIPDEAEHATRRARSCACRPAS